jgi:cysteine desulfurase
VIYLDHNATTALDPAVLERMLPFLTQHYGNPSSIHAAGQRTRQAIDDAREQVAAALACAPKELVFTSGGTEANNLALRGAWAARKAKHRRIITSAVEHPSVLDTVRALAAEGADVVELPVDSSGQLRLSDLESALTDETALVSLMWANNETGVRFPIEQVGELCRARGVSFHVDAVQVAGKLGINAKNLPADLLTLSGHKVYGPKGVGALWIRKGVQCWTVQTGGHQERGRRAGTENVAAIVGFGEALTRAVAAMTTDTPRIEALRDRFESEVLRHIADVQMVGSGAPRLPNTSNICFRNLEGEGLLMGLDLAGICASAGSACTAGSLEPSHVIRAMGFGPEWVRGAVRFSFGRANTDEEVDRALSVLRDLVPSLRARK